MNAAAPARPEPDPLPQHVRVLVIGAGFAGIGAAVTLTRDGQEVLVLERADDVGGTWRDNTYPGCACDVQSDLYCFSFAPNPAWTRTFAPQREILAYLHDVVRRFKVGHLIRCGVAVTAARWDEPTARWHVSTTLGDLTADVLVSGAGGLNEPKLPNVPGIDTFTGQVFHSARWDPSIDLRGRDVAVVGTGASAIQIVPSIAESVASLVLFQRTAAWVLPRRDKAVPGWKRRLFALVPFVQKVSRALLYLTHEITVLGFVWRPFILRAAERMGRAHLRNQVSDPHLRAVLTPTYHAGCKRVLLSDDYYPALSRHTSEVVPSALATVEGDTLIAEDGTKRRVDALILATGFEVSDLPVARMITGKDGRTLHDVWAVDGMQALRGSTVHGFPNLFFLVGPNTGLGHSSMVHVIESQLAYLRDALRTMDERGCAAIEATDSAQQAWNADVRRHMARTIWTTGGCSSWYQDAAGRVTVLWPGSTLRLRRETRRLDPAEYTLTPAAAVTRRTDRHGSEQVDGPIDGLADGLVDGLTGTGARP
jgi:cation diffusion facilitator CzcD-associated flavoprotein CzcO